VTNCSVFGKSLLSPSEKLAWSVCLGAIAETVQLIAAQVNVKAVCHVDEDSGLLEFPINGNVVFTQPVSSAITQLSWPKIAIVTRDYCILKIKNRNKFSKYTSQDKPN